MHARVYGCKQGQPRGQYGTRGTLAIRHTRHTCNTPHAQGSLSDEAVLAMYIAAHRLLPPTFPLPRTRPPHPTPGVLLALSLRSLREKWMHTACVVAGRQTGMCGCRETERGGRKRETSIRNGRGEREERRRKRRGNGAREGGRKGRGSGEREGWRDRAREREGGRERGRGGRERGREGGKT